MQNFHENKLWQDAFVVLMDVHEAFEGEVEEQEEELVEETVKSATDLSAKIADGLSRLDHRFGRQVIFDAIGMVAVVRTHLAIAWGRGILDDETFKDLDTKYSNLSQSLQNYK